MGEFGGGVCGGSWWNSSQNLLAFSSCSLPINDTGNLEGWTSHDMIKDTTCTSYESTGSASDKSVVIQEFDQPNTNGNMASIDSSLNMIESSFFTSTNNTVQQDWNQDLVLDNGRLDQNYSHLLQEATPLNPSMNHRPQIRENQNLYDDLSSNSSFSVPASSSPYNYNLVQNLLRHLFDIDSEPEQSIEDNYSLSFINSNEFLPEVSSIPKVKRQIHSQVANKTSWNSTATMDNFPMSLRRQFESVPLSVNKTKPNNSALKRLNNKEDEISMIPKKTNDGPTFKRPRIETPSPLPTFKVRKEKMGDRITALQQLVSPFGKTDTASVLYEAIEYIKFLHDQVNALSTPYLKSGSPPLQSQQKIRHEEEINKDLRGRGLCLVPVSSTFPVASETTADFWTTTFGGSFN